MNDMRIEIEVSLFDEESATAPKEQKNKVV